VVEYCTKIQLNNYCNTWLTTATSRTSSSYTWYEMSYLQGKWAKVSSVMYTKVRNFVYTNYCQIPTAWNSEQPILMIVGHAQFLHQYIKHC
jgi:hypothetical protein